MELMQSGGDDDRDYVYTGGLAGVLDGAGVIDNTDVVELKQRR